MIDATTTSTSVDFRVGLRGPRVLWWSGCCAPHFEHKLPGFPYPHLLQTGGCFSCISAPDPGCRGSFQGGQRCGRHGLPANSRVIVTPGGCLAGDCRTIGGGLPTVVLRPLRFRCGCLADPPSLRIRGVSGAPGELRISDSGITQFRASQAVGEGAAVLSGGGIFNFAIVSRCGLARGGVFVCFCDGHLFALVDPRCPVVRGTVVLSG